MIPVRVLRIAAGGDGVGRLEDGRTIFVPRTAPGDLAEVTLTKSARRFARGRLHRLLEPSESRVEPRCPHYAVDRCGGCQLQHLSIEAQREAKRTIVGDALRRLAGAEVADPDITPSERDWGYRTKLTLAVGAGGRRIGLHRYDRPGETFDLASCEITEPALIALWLAVRERRTLLPADATHLILRLDRTGRAHLIVQCSGARVWSRARELSLELERDGIVATLWWQPEAGAARALAGAASAYPATVFEQVHSALADRVRAAAVELLGPLSGAHVWDLYAGVGETTRLLLAGGASVESVELDRRAVALAESWAGGDPSAPGSQQPPAGAAKVLRHAGRAEDLVGTLRPPALVITNPPRVGMNERVVEAIRGAAPRRLVYVSCDPATLARDLARLFGSSTTAAFRLTALQAFDLFPQTAHVESVAVLEAA